MTPVQSALATIAATLTRLREKRRVRLWRRQPQLVSAAEREIAAMERVRVVLEELM